MILRPSPDGTAARALRAAAPALRPFPFPHFQLRQPRPHGVAAWVVRCLAATALCVLLAACARPDGDASATRAHVGSPPAPSGPAAGTAAPATATPRSLADFALLGQGAPLPAEDAGVRTDAAQGPVLRILYNASTRGTLHPCPS
ncbi:collagen triple helix repeat domain protein [Desulfovibrio sp. A2]|nr:collagen triple helix repeat domain protein [Desulfovibrio sp. A2]